MEFELIAETAQKYMENCPVVILGSGASIPHGLPSMGTLAADLLRSISLPQGDAESSVWEAFAHQLATTNDLEKALHEIPLSPGLLAKVVAQTWRTVASSDDGVRRAVLADARALPLTRLFRHLTRTVQASVAVITTNYDRVAEYAANAAEASFFTGFMPGLFGRFVSSIASPACKLTCPGAEGHILLWKVHGSLDWFEDRVGEPVAVQGACEIHPDHRPLIVTPGVTKYRETHKDPFRSVIAHADAELEHAKCYLCIGYGFSDEHIQPKLLAKLSKTDTPILVVTKALSSAGQKVLLDKPCRKLLIFEEAPNGTLVRHPDCPSGSVVEGKNLWALPGFLDMLMGIDEGVTT